MDGDDDGAEDVLADDDDGVVDDMLE